MKYEDLFHPVAKGDFGLTDEMVYASIGCDGEMLPLYGGNDSHETPRRWVNTGCVTKRGKHITIFEGPGIILSLDGSSGSMTFKSHERFALNHHAGFLRLKESAETLCSARFFALFMQNQLRNLAVSDGSKTLSLAQLYSYEFNLPPISVQQELLAVVDEYLTSSRRLRAYLDRASSVLGRNITNSYDKYQAIGVPMVKVFDCMSGNSGLTEEFIYRHGGDAGNRYEVLSGATFEGNSLGFIPRCPMVRANGSSRPLRVFEGKEGLLVVRKGKAGAMKYLPAGRYTINDDAYILSVAAGCPYDVNLKWFEIACKNDVQGYTTNADNGTWNKAGFFTHATVDIPSIEEQEALVSYVESARQRCATIEEFQRRFENLLSFDLVV